VSAEQIAIAVENLILLGFLLWLLYGPWQETVTAILRSNLFKIRDEIFDMAADGDGISFDHPAYLEIRDRLNGMIRYACMFTWPRFLLLALTAKPKSSNSIDHLLDGIEDQEARKRIRKKLDSAFETVIGTMILRSPLLVVSIMIAVPLIIVIHLMHPMRLKRLYWRVLKPVRYEAELVSHLPVDSKMPGLAG